MSLRTKLFDKLKPTTVKPKEDFHLKVASQYVELLNSLPEFRELTTEQLRHKLPRKYRHHPPPVTPGHVQEDREARAAIIGLLAVSMQIDSFIGMKFIERSVTMEG
jgi:hypothetical protein